MLHPQQRGGMKGECLACTKTAICFETSVEKAKSGYSCPLFEEVTEAVDQARFDIIKQFGDDAITAILNRKKDEDGHNGSSAAGERSKAWDSGVGP